MSDVLIDFEPLVARSLAAIPFDVVARDMPADMATQIIPGRSGDTVMRTRMAQAEGLGEFRSVCIEGARVHIVTLFWWPDPTLDAPVYAMEYVVFGKKPVAAVVDLAPLAGPASHASSEAVLTESWREHPSLTPADDPPDWYQECRSGHDVFVRPTSVDAIAELETLHLNAWKRALSTLSTAPRLNAEYAAHHAQALQVYKDHHRHNTPGLRFLQRAFGEAWTEDYLRGWVFS